MVSREPGVIRTSVHDNRHNVATKLFNQHFQENEVCFHLADPFDVIEPSDVMMKYRTQAL